MGARVLVIGFDAMEVDLVDRFMADGLMLEFGRLADGAATVTPELPLDTLPGAIWPELNMGEAGWRSGVYFHPLQIHTGEGALRLLEESEVDGESQYWVQAARRGLRTLAFDVPQMVVVPDLPNAVQIAEWYVHDRTWTTRSEPPEALDEVLARWGAPIVDGCDRAHDQTTQTYRIFRDDLVRQVERKTDALTTMIERESWDLVVVGFGESHCGGHQLLHFEDPTNPWHDADAPADLRTGLRTVYDALDGAVGALRRAAGPEAVTIVITSHGMAENIGGYFLLDPFLAGLWRNRVGDALATPSRWPEPVRRIAQAVVPAGWRARRRQLSGEVGEPLESSRAKAARVPNNRIAAIRLNLVGREPHGCVHPGDEAEAVIAELTDALLDLRLVEGGEPIVASVERTDELFGPDRHPDLPDVLVRFRRDLGPLDSCFSSRVGAIESSVRVDGYQRTGDHTEHARWWFIGGGFAPGRGLSSEGAAAVDLGPTVLSVLGIDDPVAADGRSLTT